MAGRIIASKIARLQFPNPVPAGRDQSQPTLIEKNMYMRFPLASFRCPGSLACIAHKCLDISERCRLWQQDIPATPEHPAAVFWKKVSKTNCLTNTFQKGCTSDAEVSDVQLSSPQRARRSVLTREICGLGPCFLRAVSSIARTSDS
jgi:hypothetical protein